VGHYLEAQVHQRSCILQQEHCAQSREYAKLAADAAAFLGLAAPSFRFRFSVRLAIYYLSYTQEAIVQIGHNASYECLITTTAMLLKSYTY
jgi:hypothetical protein